MGPSNKQDDTGADRASGLYTIGGAALVIFGGALLLSQRFAGVELAPWLYYTAVGALIFGMIEWALGRMTAEAAWDWNKSLLFALGLALLIRWPIAEPYRIPSGSMAPTLHGDPNFGKGDRVFVNKWIYGVRYPFLNKRIWHGQDPERWDIVVFKAVEPDAEHPTLVKRIVGMPGEQVHISSGNVYVDGELLPIPDFMPEDQSYTSSGSMDYGIRPAPEFSIIPERHYLVLGDNSANSRDGRYFGWLPNEHIVGRVASVWWPPARWHDFTGFSSSWWWNTLLVLLGGYVFVRLFVGRSWPVLNAARNGVDHVFVNFLSHGLRLPFTPWKLKHWGQPARGDLVLYQPAGEARTEYDYLIGRVAALGGEEVLIDHGTLHIDGRPQNGAAWLQTPIRELKNGTSKAGKARGKGATRVPAGQVYLLADCLDDQHATDSRTMGCIPEGQLMGKATCVWWPPTRARKVRRD